MVFDVVAATHLVEIREKKEDRMDRSCQENPAISDQLLANQPAPGEKLSSQAASSPST